YQLAGWAPGMARTFQWLGIGASDEAAQLTLTAGAQVSGRVVDEGGAGVTGAHVRFSGASDWSQQASSRHDAAVSGKDGAFTLDAMPAGTFRFVATHADHAPGTSALITLDGKLPRANVVITVETAAIVRGVVVDAGKQPIPSARVRIGVQSNPRAMIFAPPRQAYTDARGAFELRGLPRRELAAVALHDSGASQTITVDTTRGDVTDVTLAIDVTGTIAGVVVDPAGQPMEGVQVTAGPSFADNRTAVDFSQWRLRGFPQALTDGAGTFKLAGLAPGSYTVSAAPASSRSRRGPGVGDGQTAKTGDTNVRIVLPPEGGVKGKVALADGSSPSVFSVAVGMTSQVGNADGTFVLDGLPPQPYELAVRGPSFQTRAVTITVESGKTADAGTITVEKGRSIGGHVVADGRPVPGAKVFAGRLIFGNGTSSSAQFGPMGAGTKSDTTDASGAFSIAGFGPGDVTVVAEHESIGRSRGIRLPTLLPGQTELTLALEKFGALTGVLRQGGKPAEGVFVTCQSTTTPGAIYSVASGPDGSYRFDRLAPDIYKASATLGMPMTGMKFYSKQIEVPPGKEVTIDLSVEPGSVTLDVTAVASNGKVGVASVYLASGVITARSMNELGLKMAAAGPGASQWVIVRRGEPARFADVAPGTYSACVVPYPAEVQGMAAMGYAERHGDAMPAFCKQLTVAASPTAQTASVPVELPPFIADGPPGGGSGSQAGSGSGT
ncbi:MAG: carboxypeptidase-like regulatory domain-containing protein, partial [Myxococcota bacterium]|nr:carboxypeptidase-like regulatory domain-containing protein [Myxococcota bacterium]